MLSQELSVALSPWRGEEGFRGGELGAESWGSAFLAGGWLGSWTPSAGLGYEGRPLTHQRHPHAQGCPVDAEVLQDVLAHEAQHREPRPVARVVELWEDAHAVSGWAALSYGPREPGHSLAVSPWADHLRTPCLSFPIWQMGVLLTAPLTG